MGAHVWLPWFLEHNWFPKLRLSGWSPDWYAGFPVGQYYFPFPSVMVAVLEHRDAVQRRVQDRDGQRADHAPGRRRTTFAKGMRAPFPAPPAFAIAALGMLVQERTDWNIYGGNIASTLAGEYSFEIALALVAVRARRARVHARYREAAVAARRCSSRPRSCRTSSSRSSWASPRCCCGWCARRAARGRSRSRSVPSGCCSPRCGRCRCSVNRRTRRACGTRRCSRRAARSSSRTGSSCRTR